MIGAGEAEFAEGHMDHRHIAGLQAKRGEISSSLSLFTPGFPRPSF